METKERIIYALAGIWGGVYAAFLQKTEVGEWLATDRTWLSVVIGVGVDWLLMRPIIPEPYHSRVVKVIACSAIGIIARSLYNELHPNGRVSFDAATKAAQIAAREWERSQE